MDYYTKLTQIYSAEDRAKFLKDFNLSNLTKKELETLANLILFGKDEDGKSAVDKGEVLKPKTKFQTFQKNQPVSLEALLESPTFSETLLVDKWVYKREKPKLDYQKLKKIPGIQELWTETQQLQDLYDQNTGKKPLIQKVPQKALYFLKHELIELKKRQYQMMDSYYPPIPHATNKTHFYPDAADTHLTYLVYPRGVVNGPNDQDFKFPFLAKTPATALPLPSSKKFFSFLEPAHIYLLILNYWDLKLQVEQIPQSLIHNLLWTLDFYIEKANLTPQQNLIVQDKKLRLSNKEISKHLFEELGIQHQENYISTIWNRCCRLIAAAANLNYDEYLCQNYDKAWKKCSCCGRILLRDSRNFVHKKRSADGFQNRCKECDRAKRGEGIGEKTT